LSWSTTLQVLAGIPVGLAVYYLLLRPLTRYLIRWRQARWLAKNSPAKGTRPQVRLVHNGVTYDLTDQLLRVNDDEQDRAVWLVQGPQHLRFVDGEYINLQLEMPAPKKTSVTFQLTSLPSGYGRFATLEELIKQYPELS
jgi:hypothetical protein